MSHNLYFAKGKKTVEFPFQTPTPLTRLIVFLPTNAEKIAALEGYLVGAKAPFDPDLVKRVRQLLSDGYTLKAD